MECDKEHFTSDPSVLFFKEKLIINILKEISASKTVNVSDSLRSKLKKILADVDLSLYMSLHKLNDSDYRSSNVFGLAPLAIEELTFNEQKALQMEVDKWILDKYPKLLETYEEISQGSIVQNVTSSKTTFSDEQNKLRQMCDVYIGKLCESMEYHAEMCSLMKEWIQARIGTVVERAEHSVQLFDVKNKLLELKARIIEVQLLLSAFSQNNNSVMAYMEINKDITNKIDKLRSEITLYKKIIEEGL